jgi:hypothetical protein
MICSILIQKNWVVLRFVDFYPVFGNQKSRMKSFFEKKNWVVLTFIRF